MRSSRKIEFTEEAETDLQSLLDYSLATWGEQQQDHYAGRVAEAIRDLLVYPELGADRHDIAPGLRNRRVGQHVIYYRVLAKSIRIVRILQARMNPEQHLRGRS
ncbi:MAG: hypothetical protein K0S42_3079 [Microvirga sp.]|jgi:toxin ParE1/3/4|nr:hypothetical protein [Microvirga sp.]